MEHFLSDLESRARTVRQAGLSGVAQEGWRRAEESLRSATDAMGEGFERARHAKQLLRTNIEIALKRAREQGLLRYEDLPTPWKGNPHITRGYRFTESAVECVYSAFKLNNETVNIWSHAIGLVIVISIAFYFYPTSAHWSLSTNTDVFFAALFFFAACKCLVCSCMWHTMSSIADQTVMERFACVDYTGISLLIAASIMTTEYAAFYCEPVSRWTYMTLTALLGLGGTIVPWHPFFNRADMSWARVAFYVSLGATGFLPLFQLNLTRGPEWTAYFYAPVMNSIAVYILGALIYASKMPEKWVPGWFDYFGGSHNIWHFAVIGGILFHYTAMYEMFSGAYQRAANECSVY
jgi:adiponectin receptor